MISTYGEANVEGYFYFIDGELTKNKKYYLQELDKMSKDYGVKVRVCYGDTLFKELGMEDEWSEILKFLKLWKKDIPDLPEINFDLDAESSFEEIKDISSAIFRKLLSNDEIYNEIILTVFPEKKTLKLLLSHFKALSGNKIYQTLYQTLNNKLGNQNIGLF